MNPTYAPHATHISIGVASVHLPFVIQLDGDVQGVLGRACPLKDLHHATGQSGHICYEHDRIHITARCGIHIAKRHLLQYMTMVNPAHCRQPVWMSPVHLGLLQLLGTQGHPSMLGNNTKVYLLGPVHTHEAVHLAQVDHLILCSIPQVVVCLSLLKLLPEHHNTVSMFAGIVLNGKLPIAQHNKTTLQEQYTTAII